MKLDDLRAVLLSERETGRLTSVSHDIFDRAHSALSLLLEKVYAAEDPLSDEARAIIDETISIRETLHDLFAIRTRKILALAVMHAEGNHFDREEIRRMIPSEREMFDGIIAAISRCRGGLVQNMLQKPLDTSPGASAAASAEPDSLNAKETSGRPGSPPYALVRVLEDMEPFMGVDGKVYSLMKGDIATLPERNAIVLADRNIVLNMNLCK